MKPAGNDPALLLRALRIPGSEPQLTKAISALAASDPGFAAGLASALLEEAASRSDRALRLLVSLRALRAPLICSSEDPSTGLPPTRALQRRRSSVRTDGYIDWVFHPIGEDEPAGRTFELAVEVKINAPFGDQQLERYHNSPARKSGERGLLALCRKPPEYGELLPERYSLWLGTVLWEQIMPRLRSLSPAYDELARQWPLFLSVLDQVDDLGRPSVTWEVLRNGGRDESAKRVLEDCWKPVLEHLRGELAKTFVNRDPVDLVEMDSSRGRQGAKVKTYREGAWCWFRVPAVSDGWVVGQGLLTPGPRLRTVYRPRPSLRPWVRRRLSTALENLDAHFNKTAEGWFVRESSVQQSAAEPARAVGFAMQEDLGHLLTSGVLEVEVRHSF